MFQVNYKWERSGPNELKVNFNGALSNAEKSGGTGAIMRDEEGEVLGACCKFQFGIIDPMVIEAIAAMETIVYAADMGIQ
ncbi:hypothetical protein REPUB_Repub02eG0212100 [Reevesia pubescens]